MSRTAAAALALTGLLIGVLATALALRPRERALPSEAMVVAQVREAARLETLDVELYKKISFTLEPQAPSDSTWENVLRWARSHIQAPHGRAILFATSHLGLDLGHLDGDHVRLQGDTATVALPPIQVQVELKPGETEIIDSNLDSAQTAQLLEQAKVAFEHDTLADPALRARARASAERSLRALLLTLGFREVRFVDALPPRTPPS